MEDNWSQRVFKIIQKKRQIITMIRETREGGHPCVSVKCTQCFRYFGKLLVGTQASWRLTCPMAQTFYFKRIGSTQKKFEVSQSSLLMSIV